MAAATVWDDIDEKFLQCPICLDQLHEPKQLTCLHRLCSECLRKFLQGSQGVVQCPECREEIAVPNDGVEGFKTDFHLKNIIEFVRVKKSLVENKEAQECYSCSKRKEVSAYCLKCSGFLCKDCHEFHRMSKITKDHLPSILDLKDPAIHELGIEKLAQLVDSPRCLKHPENIMRLCCATCNYTHICVTCVHGDHVDHETKDIHTVAGVNKAKLKENLALLRGYKDNIYKLGEEIKSVARNTDTQWEEQMGTLKGCHRQQGDLLENIRKSISLNHDKRISDTEKRYRKVIDELNMDMEKEIERIRAKYAVIVDQKKRERDHEMGKEEAKSEGMLAELTKQEEVVSKYFKNLQEDLQKFKEEANERSAAASEHAEHIIKRYENLNATASSILAADNDWTAVRCIPDICSAITPLIEDMTSSFTKLTKMTQKPPKKVLLPVNVTAFPESYLQSFFQVQGRFLERSTVAGIVNVQGEGIIITKQTGNGSVYSQCINIRGEILWTEVPESYFGISQSDVQMFKMKAAVSCFSDATAALNRGNRRKSFWGVHLRDMVDHWPTDLSLHCVATDPLNKRIFTGFRNCRDIYVFNDTLKHVTTFSLPPTATYPSDLAVAADGNLIVCDALGNGVFSSNLKGEVQTTYFLPSSVLNLENCIAQSLCADSKDNVFVLLSNQWRKVVVQYRKSVGYPIAYRDVGLEISNITVTQDGLEEKLLLVASTIGLFTEVYRTTPYIDEG